MCVYRVSKSRHPVTCFSTDRLLHFVGCCVLSCDVRLNQRDKTIETTVLQAEIILLRDLILHLYTAYMVYLVITPTYFIISKTIERKGKPLVAKMNKSCFFFRTSFFTRSAVCRFSVLALRRAHVASSWPRNLCVFFCKNSRICVYNFFPQQFDIGITQSIN